MSCEGVPHYYNNPLVLKKVAQKWQETKFVQKVPEQSPKMARNKICPKSAGTNQSKDDYDFTSPAVKVSHNTLAYGAERSQMRRVLPIPISFTQHPQRVLRALEL